MCGKGVTSLGEVVDSPQNSYEEDPNEVDGVSQEDEDSVFGSDEIEDPFDSSWHEFDDFFEDQDEAGALSESCRDLVQPFPDSNLFESDCMFHIDDDSGPFHYEPLDYTKRSFRVLNILPSTRDGRLRCSLRNELIPIIPEYCAFKYNALSYTWGPPEPLQHIELNGRPFAIRQNLWDFLNVAREQPEICRTLWIDAICIDQDNGTERNHQVEQMKDIYSAASTVYAWLGNSDDGIDTAVDFLATPRDGLNHFFEAAHHLAQEKCEDRFSIIESMNSLFNREYWDRMWIVQEVQSARLVKILCGQKLVPWTAVKEFITTFLDAYPTPDQFSWQKRCVEMVKVSAATRIARSDVRDRPRTLLELVEAFGDGLCSDIRDRVYSLVGLARDCQNLQIDYSISPKALFFEVMQHSAPDDAKPKAYRARSLRQALYLSIEDLTSYLEDPATRVDEGFLFDIDVSPFMLHDLTSKMIFRPLKDAQNCTFDLEADDIICHFDSHGIDFAASYWKYGGTRKAVILRNWSKPSYLTMCDIISLKTSDGPCRVFLHLYDVPYFRDLDVGPISRYKSTKIYISAKAQSFLTSANSVSNSENHQWMEKLQTWEIISP